MESLVRIFEKPKKSPYVLSKRWQYHLQDSAHTSIHTTVTSLKTYLTYKRSLRSKLNPSRWVTRVGFEPTQHYVMRKPTKRRQAKAWVTRLNRSAILPLPLPTTAVLWLTVTSGERTDGRRRPFVLAQVLIKRSSSSRHTDPRTVLDSRWKVTFNKLDVGTGQLYFVWRWSDCGLDRVKKPDPSKMVFFVPLIRKFKPTSWLYFHEWYEKWTLCNIIQNCRAHHGIHCTKKNKLRHAAMCN